MEILILLGAPGSGKGTAAGFIAGQGGFTHISTGDMFREAIRRRTAAGREADRHMGGGDLVPDDMVMAMIRERLSWDPPRTRYVFDGFPRTVPQAALLDRHLGKESGRILAVILLDVPSEVLAVRLTGRRVCPACGAIFHTANRPPRQEGVCDACGGSLIRRDDDHETTIRRRLDVYRQRTEGLVEYYETRHLLRRIDASGPPADVHRDLARHLDLPGEAAPC